MKPSSSDANRRNLRIPITGSFLWRLHIAMSLIVIPFYNHYISIRDGDTTYVFLSVPRLPRKGTEIWPWLFTRVSRLLLGAYVISIIGTLIQRLTQPPSMIISTSTVSDLTLFAWLLLLIRDGIRTLKNATVLDA